MADYTINATLTLDGVSGAITAQSGTASDDIPLADYKAHKTIVRCVNTGAATATITLGAGGAEGELSAKGAISGTVVQNAVKYFGPFEASRLLDTTGDLLMTVTGGGVTPADVKFEIIYVNG